MMTDTGTSTIFRDALAFEDGDETWIAWPARAAVNGVARLDLHRVAADGQLGPATQTFAPAPATPAIFEEIAGRTFDGRRTVVARDTAGNFWSLDEQTKLWAMKKALGRDDAVCTDIDANSLVLTVDSPTTGLVGARGAPLSRYDLRRRELLASSVFPEEMVSCANAYVRTASGLEIFTSDVPGPVTTSVDAFWRRGEQDQWRPLDTPRTLIARAVIAGGDELWISGSRASIVLLDDEPSRPEIPPRECGSIPLSLTIGRLVVARDGSVFAGGSGLPATFLIPAARP